MDKLFSPPLCFRSVNDDDDDVKEDDVGNVIAKYVEFFSTIVESWIVFGDRKDNTEKKKQQEQQQQQQQQKEKEEEKKTSSCATAVKSNFAKVLIANEEFYFYKHPRFTGIQLRDIFEKTKQYLHDESKVQELVDKCALCTEFMQIQQYGRFWSHLGPSSNDILWTLMDEVLDDFPFCVDVGHVSRSVKYDLFNGIAVKLYERYPRCSHDR